MSSSEDILAYIGDIYDSGEGIVLLPKGSEYKEGDNILIKDSLMCVVGSYNGDSCSAVFVKERKLDG